MTTKKNRCIDQFGFPDDADEALWATRDYFWALNAGLLGRHGPGSWRSFRAGYASHANDSEPGYGPRPHPADRAA